MRRRHGVMAETTLAYLVTITQGAFGSYSLHTDDNPHSYKVERVK